MSHHNSISRNENMQAALPLGGRSTIEVASGNLSDLLAGGPDNLSVALDLARRGFVVFPLRDWSDGEGWKPIRGFPEKATTDPAQIQTWWTKWLRHGSAF